MKEIQLSKGGKNKGKYVALVDDEDFETLNQFRWYAMKYKRTVYAGRHIVVNGNRATQFLQWDILNGKGIDHIDGNGLNNQKSNLRFCTISENQMNSRKRENTSSIYKGVHFNNRNKKWKAQIYINEKSIHLGYFTNEIEAAKAYNTKAIALFCEFANLNVIPNEKF